MHVSVFDLIGNINFSEENWKLRVQRRGASPGGL